VYINIPVDSSRGRKNMSQKKTVRHQTSQQTTAENAVVTSSVPSKKTKKEAEQIFYIDRI
jgi:hypothetical protein